MPVKLGKSYISQKTPYYPLFERSFETARIFVMEGSKQVLVKVMLFQLREHVHPQDGAMLTFFMNEVALYWSFQLMYHLF